MSSLQYLELNQVKPDLNIRVNNIEVDGTFNVNTLIANSMQLTNINDQLKFGVDPQATTFNVERSTSGSSKTLNFLESEDNANVITSETIGSNQTIQKALIVNGGITTTKMNLNNSSNQIVINNGGLRSFTINDNISTINNLVWSIYDTTFNTNFRACIDPFTNISSTTVLDSTKSGYTFALQDAASGDFNITLPLPDNAPGWNLRFSITSLINGNDINIISSSTNTFNGYKFENNTANALYGYTQIKIVNAQATLSDSLEIWCDGSYYNYRAYSKKAGAFILS